MIGHRFIYTSEITGYKTEGVILFTGNYIATAFNPLTGLDERFVVKLITSTCGITYERTEVQICEYVGIGDNTSTFLIP